MRFRLLILAACLFGGLFAGQDVGAAGDPFATFHEAVNNQLSSILERAKIAPSPTAAPASHEDRPMPATAQPNAISEVALSSFAGRFWGGRDGELDEAVDRLQRIRPKLESILEQEGVPRQLTAVVLVESGAQPLALSPRQARGLWQIIPETARRYGLIVSDGRDERTQIDLATRAAGRYLRDLYERFGDWPLALAGYNAGQNTVENALSKGRGTTFWQLSAAGLLPSETRNYVPAVLAAMDLLGGPPTAVPAAESRRASDWVYASAGISN